MIDPSSLASIIPGGLNCIMNAVLTASLVRGMMSKFKKTLVKHLSHDEHTLVLATVWLGTRTVPQAAREAVRLGLLDANGPTGALLNEDSPLPW